MKVEGPGIVIDHSVGTLGRVLALLDEHAATEGEWNRLERLLVKFLPSLKGRTLTIGEYADAWDSWVCNPTLNLDLPHKQTESFFLAVSEKLLSAFDFASLQKLRQKHNKEVPPQTAIIEVS